MTATVVELAERGRPNPAYEAFRALLGVITDSSDPDRAGVMIAGGILVWLAHHRGLSRDYLVSAMLAAIDDEAATPRA